VAMNGPAAAIAWPDGTQYENSALLKVQNRGTCQLCHDPTGTLYPGIVVGNVTNDPTSGP
jgi:hypothetical protein